LRRSLLDLSAQQLTQGFGIFVGYLLRLEASTLRLDQLLLLIPLLPVGFGVDALEVWFGIAEFVGIAKDGKHQTAFECLNAYEVLTALHNELADSNLACCR